MGIAELKLNLHTIIDKIQSEQVLRTLYDFLKMREGNEGELWESLTEVQKREVLLAYDESEEENNLLERDKIFKKIN